LENNHLSVHRHARLAFMQPPQSFVLRRARGEKAWGIRISTTDASQGMANALSAVSSDSPAARAGLLVGDTICAVNGARCQHDGDAARYLKLCSGPVELRVSREAPASESAAAGKKRRHSAIKEPDPTPASESAAAGKKRRHSAAGPPASKESKPTCRVTDLNALLRKLPESEPQVLKLLKGSPGLAMQSSKDDDDLRWTNVGSGGSSVGRIWPLHIAAQWAASPRVVSALLAAWPHAAQEFAWDPEGHEQCWQGGGRDGSRAALPLHLALEACCRRNQKNMEPDAILLIFNAYPEAARWRNWLRSLPLHLAMEWALHDPGMPSFAGTPSKEQLNVVKLIGEAFPEAINHTDMNGQTPAQNATMHGAHSKTFKKLLKALNGKRSKWSVGDTCEDCDRFPEEHAGCDSGDEGYGSGYSHLGYSD